uniref:Ubiquitin specific peptidase 25 [Ovis aries] n=1 Tax=Lepeophtheirus salmonis TaxID=72036 RepID=A0A0K2V7C5_LEPSM
MVTSYPKEAPLPKTPSNSPNNNTNSPEQQPSLEASMEIVDSSKEVSSQKTFGQRNVPSLLDVSSNTQDEDLQKAIKLSLEEAHKSQVSSGVSQEDQDVSKALEASFMEGGSNRRKRKDKWEDPLNPHDRTRNGIWPVGLKNVGQTCWFSAVIQSLFYLPAFRTLVLNFSIPSSITKNSLKSDKKTKKVLEFMEELRKLFSLLVASRRKYVDPVRSVEILKGSIGSASIDNNQQDVSEFTHKVLEWAELAFKLVEKNEVEADESMDESMDCKLESSSSSSSAPPLSSSSNNPMANLFYGQVMTEGKNRGLSFSHTDTIGQWNLLVNNFNDIHESLENSTALEYFDNDSLNGQERWFSKLQPVLFFELSRFQFNQERKLAEKIHNKLEFPEKIYMDRYMASNKNITRHKREQTRILKEKRDILSNKLNKFTHYGSTSESEKIPLSRVLQYAMEFANSGTNLMQVDQPNDSPKSMMTPASSLVNINEVETSMEVETQFLSKNDEDNNIKDCDKNESGDFCPTPKFVSETELKIIQNCFLRWKSEVEVDVSTLESSRTELDSQIKEMYSEDSLKKMEYRLHAVMVHEGYVDSGHYWAYVYDHKRKTWLKFNDNSVNETTWDELFKESVGGHSNTSAYSLVYVDTSRPELFDPHIPLEHQKMEDAVEEQLGEETTGPSLFNCLPNDLRDFVHNDNLELQKEILEWDERQEALSKKESEMKARSNHPSSNTTSVDEIEGGEKSTPELLRGNDDVQVIKEKLNYAHSHASLVAHLSSKLIKTTQHNIKSNDISHIFNDILELTVSHYNKLCNSRTCDEIRLESFPIYLLLNDVNERVIQISLIEQYAFLSLENESKFAQDVRKKAERELLNIQHELSTEFALLKGWHRDYQWFRLSVYWFIRGMEDLSAHKFDESLECFSIASYITVNLRKNPCMGPKKTLDLDRLLRYLRTSISEVNHSLIKEFKLGERLDSVISNLQRVVPVMNFLQLRVDNQSWNNSSPKSVDEDSQCLEEVRSRWCSLLGDNDIANENSSMLSDAVRLVLEPPPDLCPPIPRVMENLPESINEKTNLELNMRYLYLINGGTSGRYKTN